MPEHEGRISAWVHGSMEGKDSGAALAIGIPKGPQITSSEVQFPHHASACWSCRTERDRDRDRDAKCKLSLAIFLLSLSPTPHIPEPLYRASKSEQIG